MGYRSEVKSLIYGTADEMREFKEAHFDLYNQVVEDFGNEISNHTNSKYDLIYLDVDYVKWYDEYEEVQRWDTFLDLARQDGLNVEFVRVGEESGDIDVDNSGNDCEWYLEPVQRVEAHFDR